MNKNIERAIDAIERAAKTCQMELGPMEMVDIGLAPRRMLPYLDMDVNLRVALEYLKREVID
ncbi:MAG: hypothetical protein UY48_C0010G0027 [Candidatus Gottesmanbacteria bacterium GW2011_GWB1_49_7]|uniref:Uncharacterized protein n=1 Tax=Candidatus Gottesmanbacteria bacterium GW2011_GWB1_49_7 TaxID=1618448 RepID=A0A0G1W289_9BACT|nr:MAG: hypothetical protein UY48_C0010G0027 [Candidatus Gottesmanbacteria bacterium GW2011_GWB1_49_7]